MWGFLLNCPAGPQKKVTALDNFQTSRRLAGDRRHSGALADQGNAALSGNGLFVGAGFEVTGDQGVDGRTLLCLERDSQGISKTYRFTRTIPAPVDATQALNLSAGVANSKVLRGRSFS